ncbi:MAG: RecX family transcriptional regulator [Acidobacteria bacterium]|nr:RecX family transcriptional regulator [Acidobacteriota bacterium]
MRLKRRWKRASAASSSEPAGETEQPSLDQLYAGALRALTRRPFPTRELEQKLLRSCTDAAAVNRVIERLKTSGYLDDRKFAESFIQSRLHHKAQGRARIERELCTRGLSPNLIREELEKAYPAEAEREPLQHALDRKLKSLSLPMDAKKLSRLYNHLLRRGFPGEAIRLELRRRLKMEMESDDEPL